MKFIDATIDCDSEAELSHASDNRQRRDAPYLRTHAHVAPIHQMKLERVQVVVARLLGLEPASMDECFLPATERDLPQILRLRQTLVEQSAIRDRDYLQWRYRFSPVSGSDSLDQNRIWVFSRGQRVLGMLGVESIRLHVDGRVVPAYKVMDLLVSPDVDRKGLGVWMQLKLQSLGRPVIALGSNPNSVGIISKLFRRLPNQLVYKTVLDSRPYFSARQPYAPVAGLLSRLYYLALSTTLLSRQIAHGRPGKTVVIGKFSPQDERLLGQMNRGAVHFDRSADYLNWRLLGNPMDRVTITTVNRDKQMTGYFAIALRDSAGRVKNASLLDWGVSKDRDSEGMLIAALIECQRRLRKAGVTSITAFAYNEDSRRLLRKAGFCSRTDDSKTVSLYCADPVLLQTLSESSRWFITGADTDYA